MPRARGCRVVMVIILENLRCDSQIQGFGPLGWPLAQQDQALLYQPLDSMLLHCPRLIKDHVGL